MILRRRAKVCRLKYFDLLNDFVVKQFDFYFSFFEVMEDEV